MAQNVAEVHLVLDQCGIHTQQVRNRIINNEGFGSLEDIGLLEGDSDVTEMAKRMATRPTASRVHMTTVQIKKMQALVWWIRDRMTHSQPLVAIAFDDDALNAALERKRIEKEGTETEVKISEIMRFDPNKYEDCNDAFRNVLALKKGKYGVAWKGR